MKINKTIKYSDDYKEIKSRWDESKEWKQDPYGYFLIRLNRKKKLIEVGLCKEKNVVSVKLDGKLPQEIYYTVLRERMVSSLQHAAYLGKELHKAYVALKLGIEYVQDSELDFKKKYEN